MITATRSPAVDVFRGATLALMIVVNMSISESLSFGPLLHAQWHGLTLTDLVFPSFLFAVGASMYLSMQNHRYVSGWNFMRRTIVRSILIFTCGFLLYWFPFFQFDTNNHLALLPISNARVLGVLQRIALCYFMAAVVVRFAGTAGTVVFTLFALSANAWILATFGDYSLEGNAALKLDKWLLGDAHLYRGEGIPFDPEGILGTLPATVNVIGGYIAAKVLFASGADRRTYLKLVAFGAGMVVLGFTLDPWQPINKKLWTTSYAICTTGFSLLALLGVSGALRLGGGFPLASYFFSVYGKNTLFIYLVAEIGMSVLWLVNVGDAPLFMVVFHAYFESWVGGKFASLAFAMCYAFACWLIGYFLERRKIYIRL